MFHLIKFLNGFAQINFTDLRFWFKMGSSPENSHILFFATWKNLREFVQFL